MTMLLGGGGGGGGVGADSSNQRAMIVAVGEAALRAAVGCSSVTSTRA